jgi:hypothetical protein
LIKFVGIIADKYDEIISIPISEVVIELALILGLLS